MSHEAAARALVAEYVWPLNKVSVTTAKALIRAARTLDERPDGFYPYAGPVQHVYDALADELRACKPTPSVLDELRAARYVRATRGEVSTLAEIRARMP
jgi:hypothetical protein